MNKSTNQPSVPCVLSERMREVSLSLHTRVVDYTGEEFGIDGWLLLFRLRLKSNFKYFAILSLVFRWIPTFMIDYLSSFTSESRICTHSCTLDSLKLSCSSFNFSSSTFFSISVITHELLEKILKFSVPNFLQIHSCGCTS